jgi:hypothetical protein
MGQQGPSGLPKLKITAAPLRVAKGERMSEHIHELASEVSPLVHAAEVAMEDAVVALANLMAGTVARRRQAGIMPAAAQPTVLLLHRALSQAIEGGNTMLRVHGKLEDQYRTLASDDLHPLSEDAVTGQARSARQGRNPLSLVG